jgi:ribosome-binding ATPase YchF (GTP1/OBG family)
MIYVARPPRQALDDVRGEHVRGRVRSEGKEYVVQDGDVLLFRFNV